jgi:colanic acid/amylovoran biosynthesis glycosyltransferase
MSTPLLVAAPHVGAISETFIRRHMEEICPGNTAILTANISSPYAGHWTVDAPMLVHHPDRPARGWRETLRQLKLRRFLQKHQVQVILGEYLNYSFGFFQIAQQLGIPYFAHAHGRDVSEALRDRQWQQAYLAYNQAAGVITINQVSKARLIKLGIAAEKIHIIPCGISVLNELPQRSESGTGQDTIRCLAVGRMVPKKAPILVLEAFRQALQVVPNLHLDYVGAGELLSTAQQFVQAVGLSGHVTLHGSQPNAVVKTYLQNADIFLQHSMTNPETGDEEGLPVSILEAMSYGLPVVATRHAGIPEAVVEAETGFLSDEADCKGMAGHIVTLAQDEKLRSQLGEAGWRRTKALFTWERERDLLLQVTGLG